MSYLNAYGKKRFQRGGVAPAAGFKQVLNKAAVDKRKKFLHGSGYCEEVISCCCSGAMLAPMILQVQAGGGGGEENGPSRSTTSI
jgi:hypothetical protein